MKCDSSIYYLVLALNIEWPNIELKKKKIEKIQQYMKTGYPVNNRIFGSW